MFDRSLLPPPPAFYRDELQNFRIVGRRGTSLCPFHLERKPSFSVELVAGMFRCFSCGSSGGDLVDFVQLRDSCSFRSACMTLGCWKDGGTKTEQDELSKARKERARLNDVAAQLAAEETKLRIEARDRLHAYEKMQRDAQARLTQLGIEGNSAEQDDCWSVLSILEDDIREDEAVYRLLSFAPVEARARYVLNEAIRPQMISNFLLQPEMR